MIIENAYHGSGFGVTCKHNGRVDQLEDRYLGMVEAPSSNLGTSTFQNRQTKSRLRVSKNQLKIFLTTQKITIILFVTESNCCVKILISA